MRRSRAAFFRTEVEQRDAKFPRFVGEVVLNTGAWKNDDTNRKRVEHLIVAPERRGLGMFCPVGLEGDLGNLAVVGPAGSYALGALW